MTLFIQNGRKGSVKRPDTGAVSYPLSEGETLICYIWWQRFLCKWPTSCGPVSILAFLFLIWDTFLFIVFTFSIGVKMVKCTFYDKSRVQSQNRLWKSSLTWPISSYGDMITVCSCQCESHDIHLIFIIVISTCLSVTPVNKLAAVASNTDCNHNPPHQEQNCQCPFK